VRTGAEGLAAGTTIAVATLCVLLHSPLAVETGSRLGPGERVVLRDGRDLALEVKVGPRDTYASIGQKYLTDLRELPSLRGRNADVPPDRGSTLVIPYASLNDDYKILVIRDLFPDDAPRGADWIHHVGTGRLSADEESLWRLSLWFTGKGENFEALADENGLPDLGPRRGQKVVIPGKLLLPAFARLAGGAVTRPGADLGSQPDRVAARPDPRPTDPAPPAALDDDFTEVPEAETEPEGGAAGALAEPPVAEGAEQLAYGADPQGAFAIYRLKRGEALYSAVVMRYTGRVDAQDVNDLAFAIARRSGVRDVTDIPIGYPLKIPLDDLLPEYLPREDPRRQAWETSAAEVARYSNRARSSNLRGVSVILDAGHGGRDRGAFHNGIWEHDYVYDILCRIKARLEEATAASVLTTIKDRKEGYAVQETSRLRRSQAEVLLTEPLFPLRQGTAGVNLRWYLSNSYYRRLVAEGRDPLKIVFTSLHADARHPSLGGAMVYVPGAEYRRNRYGYQGAQYARFREVQEKPYVSFSRAQRARSEALSREFASSLITAFRHEGVSVHPYLPVRERIIRRRRPWVPAVLRCSEVPVQALIEVSNLSNATDSRHLADPAYRQKVANAYVKALQLYYGEITLPGRRVSSRAR
jgi:N-acetylmuramoyl-L-alanine amidase